MLKTWRRSAHRSKGGEEQKAKERVVPRTAESFQESSLLNFDLGGNVLIDSGNQLGIDLNSTGKVFRL
jgi:hypothetical protein